MNVDFLPIANSVINDLLVDMHRFADIACLGARAFGMHTRCDPCDIDVNLCVKKNILRNLVQAQSIVERTLGYSLTERYHTETLEWQPHWSTDAGAEIRFQTRWPGVSAINVVRTFTELPTLDDTPIQFALQANVPLTSGGTYCIATLDGDVVDNPNDIELQDGTGKVYPQIKQAGFPRRTVSGGWEIAVGRSDDPSTCPETPSAYHCHLVYADITPPTCTGDLVPVYPDTEIVIPIVKTETLSGGDVRYWFNIWELIHPAFQDELVDIEAGEYYKLYQAIDFACVTETESLPSIGCSDDCVNCSSPAAYTTGLTLSIKDSEDGILSLCATKGPCGCSCQTPKTLTISYKTDPALVLDTDPALVEAQEAIVYWAAANLSQESCRCPITEGFISEAQKAYTEIRVNPLTGETIQNFKHGNLYGQLVFAEKLNLIPRKRQLLRV